MKNEIKYFGKDDLTERELYLLSLDTSINIPKDIQLPSKHFACFIVWDSKNNSIQEISDLAKTLIKNGAAYICIWGNDCQRVEDICDEIDSLNSPDDSVIMTTSHKTDPIEEALYFFLTDTHPDEYYESTLSSSLAVVVDNQNNLQIVKDALSNPNQFRKYILDKEK
jgi:hypothetical protein